MRDIAFRELKNLPAYQLTVKNLTERIRIINDSMDVLSDVERKVIFLFATEPPRDAANTIREVLGYEHTQAYRIRNRALDKLAFAMFGEGKPGA